MRPISIFAVASLVAAGLAVALPAAAQPQPRVPSIVMDHLRGLEARCRAAGGQPGGGRFIVAQDFTGDRRPDYLVSEGDYVCTGRPNLFRENGEARVDIFVTNPSGQAPRVFSDKLIGFRVLAGTPTKIQIARRGALCGAGAGPTTQCATQLVWNGQSFGAGVSVSDADRAGPAAAAAPAVSASGAAPAGETETAFLARCRKELITRDAGAARWADEECGDRWKHIVASRPAADALIAALPAPGQRPSAAELKARMTGVRWAAQAPRGMLATGRLGGLEAFVEGVGAPTGIGVSWNATGAEIPYDVVGALRTRGVQVTEMACEKQGVGEGERRYAGVLSGRAPFTVTVSQRTAPTGAAMSFYSATLSLDGRHPARGSTAGCDF
ncbi:hypothetical protein [Phenylobacterium sp. SCN 70-31]|uniref:hypothetical protein n=1 Tax=Phenylobacterium sp. SCN 70-31 TaxID=1660129 RepID=UPI0008695511|nr:hypothetical protein [Phenylobacterium sp. SCN 70-31]ODT88963.1 MAG: hypothetical protein ABS78_05010 [Phenylobacterium sp. SCN 70-31]